MELKRLKLLIGLIAILFLISGCANYKITVPLENSLDVKGTCHIGAIADELPLDMTADEKPSLEDIHTFKNQLSTYLAELDFMVITKSEDNDTRYVVNGAIMEYKKGSGVARFFFGALAGASAKLVTSLELVDAETGNVVFAGNFRAEVSDWATSGDEVYNRVAKDFAKALKKQMKKFK